MADRLIKTETLQDIADAIREKRETTSTIRPSAFASEIRSIEVTDPIEAYDDAVTVDESATPTFTDDYTEGKTEGYSEGFAEGHAEGMKAGNEEAYNVGLTAGIQQGKQAEWSEFWDGLQDYGNREAYNNAFSRYTDSMFYPKYDIKPTACNYLFASCTIKNLKQRLIDCGVKLDISKSTTALEMFNNCSEITHIPILDTTSVNSLTYFISNCTKLVEVEKIILKADGSQTFSNFLGYCNALESVTIEGVIGNNGVSTRQSAKLNKASIISIINALSTTKSGLSVVFNSAAVNREFATSDGAADGSTSAEWLALVATRPNWNIVLQTW